MVCDLGTVPINSIVCPLEEQAYQAAAMLDSLMSGQKPAEATVVLPPVTLIARKSTDSVAASQPLVKRALGCM